MKNVLLIGLGRFGRYTAQKFNEMGHQVMAVDRTEDRVKKVLSYVTTAQIGDSTNEQFLQQLGVPNYDLCVVAIGDDFLSSLETTALLKDLGAKKVISRATGATQEKFLLRNGADEVVFPEKALAKWTAIRYSSDHILNYVELMEGYGAFEVKVPMEWNNMRIGDLSIRQKYGINILGVRNGQMNMNVQPDMVLQGGESLLVLGKNESVQKVFKL